MEGIKTALQSKTIWGVIISVIGKIIAVWGYELAPADAELMVQLISGIGSFVGDALAVYGRVKASKKIG